MSLDLYDTDVPKDCPLGAQQIMRVLPHRYPFLLIDKIVEREDLQMARGIKQLTLNEDFFRGHFPDDPQMPFSLVIEAMAQVGAVSVLAHPTYRGRYILFASLDNADFGRIPVPGDCLEIRSEFLNFRRGMGRTRIVCKIEDELVVEADFCFAVADMSAEAAPTE